MNFIKKYRKPIIFVFILWLLVSMINVFKPFHVDDTEFVEIAKYISKNPFHPMSGSFNMAVYNGPLYKNALHPLLLPYIYGLTIYLFGESEIFLHIVISIFSLVAIISALLISRKIVPKFPYIVTTLIILSPSFIPSANLMTDVPLLSLWILFFLLIFRSNKNNRTTHYLPAAIVLGFSLLIKFSSLILIPLFILDLKLTKRKKQFWVVIIPILFILLWSVFNFFDYGGIQILSARPNFVIYDLKTKLVLWLITLGALFPFSVTFIPLFFTKAKRMLIFLTGIIFVEFFSRVYWVFPNESFMNIFLRKVFFLNGIFVTVTTLYIIYKIMKKINFGKITDDDRHYIILSAWFIFTSLFLIKYVPFLAARHVLLVFPPILWLLSKYLFTQVSLRWIYIGAFATVSLGLVLGISDWQQANIYRVYAPKIYSQIKKQQQQLAGQSSTIWFGGFWDWQWYAKKAGMRQYDASGNSLNFGDYFVMPYTLQQNVNVFHIPMLHKIREDTFPVTALTYFKTFTNYHENPTGFYAILDPRNLPWTVSGDPIETFSIYKVITTPGDI